jgi:hypothetical protein
VNPSDYGVQGTDGLEAQAFVVMMEAAYRDCAARNASEASAHSAKSAAGRSISDGGGGGGVGLVWCLLGAWTLLHCIL